jgi:ABC-2 type transport system ATP-binding protein
MNQVAVEPAAVSAHRVGRRYGKLWALRECSLRLAEGSVVALVGPNGAGKSTLLNILAGLIEPSEGELRVLGETPDSRTGVRVAFTAQNHPLYRSLTVAEMMRAGRSLNTEWDEPAARERLAQLEIPLDRRIGKLSGGQQAQVSLTLALAKRPRLLLLDEPLAALDPIARQGFMQTMMGVAADGDVTIVLSSHVITDLERVCDHLIVLDHGRVKVAGVVDDLLAEHTVLSGPADRAESLRDHCVIGASTVGRQTIAVIRGETPRDEAWRAEPVGLEELVLTYLRNPHEATLPGPQGIVEETLA